MISDRVTMNPDKTQLLWIDLSRVAESCLNAAAAVQSRRQRSHTIDRTTSRFLISLNLSNLGVGLLFDEQFSMGDHVTAVCKSCFFQLRQLLRLIRGCLTMDSAKTLVHAFISSRLDCNSLLVGAADCVIRKLQEVQNAAARLITGTRKFDHITPILRDLH